MARNTLQRAATMAAFGCLLVCTGTAALAAPDEQTLCKDRGYPVGTPSQWFFDECVRVGSFTHQGEIPGLFRGQANTMRPSSEPMPLPAAPQLPDYRWSVGQETGLTIDDYLARQRVMALLVVRNGVLEVEREHFDYRPGQSIGVEFVIPCDPTARYNYERVGVMGFDADGRYRVDVKAQVTQLPAAENGGRLRVTLTNNSPLRLRISAWLVRAGIGE
jgi:hypothetical protein